MYLVPTVSIGNVPQLALDLILHTYNFEYVKPLESVNVAPLIAPQDYVAEPQLGVCTALDLYKLGDLKLIQIRGPPLSSKFVDDLSKIIGSDQALIIGSASAAFHHSEILHINSTDLSSNLNSCEDSGLFQTLVSKLTSKGLLSYVYEGDNTADAFTLAAEIVNELDLPPKDLVAPVSWSSFYGREAPLKFEEGIYS